MPAPRSRRWRCTKWSEKNLGSLNAIAIALLAGGIAMWVIDAWASRRDAFTTHVEQMNILQAIWIGLCQTLSAIFPGTSRSMSTIAAGQIADLDRPTALEFSFLLSIPTMIAATGWDLLKEIHPSKAAVAAGAVAAHVVDEPAALDRAGSSARWFRSSWRWAWWSGSCAGCASTASPSSPSTASCSAVGC